MTPRWLIPIGVAAVNLTLILLGLATGDITVSRTVEAILVVIAAVASWAAVAISVAVLFDAIRFFHYRAPALLATAGLAFALAVVVVQPGEAKTPAPVTVALSQQERNTLERDVVVLQREGRVQLAASLSSLLASGGAIGAGLLLDEASAFEVAGATGANIAATLIGAAARVAPKISVTPTLRIDHPTFALGGLHFALGPRSQPPTQSSVNFRRATFSLGTIRINRFNRYFSRYVNRYFVRNSHLLPHTR